ncbi:AAC(3) family N-acetyltransferase [Candidatus Dependentiae bacterium]
MNDYTKEDIVKALIEVGIKKSDNIFIHSNLGFFGKLKDAQKSDDYCSIFKDAIFNVIGEDGTLIVPTFSYSFCRGDVFDKNKTPSVCGLFSEMVRKDDKAFRSEDANFSVAAIGKNAKFLTENVPEYSFGKGSFCDRFLKLNGKFCNFNFDAASTFIHYAERCLNVFYRFDKAFNGDVIVDGKKINKNFYHFCYDLEKKEHAPEFSVFDRVAKKLKLVKCANLGRGQILTITARDTFDLVASEYEKNSWFLLKGNKVLREL